MIDILEFNGKIYPYFQSQGNAARWVMPFAMEVCKPESMNIGYDIGYGEWDWKMPHAIGVDIKSNDGYSATSLPDVAVDYIFSSHTLEHVSDWVGALDYWTSKIKPGGVLFLYLPHPTQEYWLPFHNRKHIHSLSPDIIRNYLEATSLYHKIFVSENDANNSFSAFAEKL